MTTHSRDLRAIIIREIQKSHPEPVGVEKLYGAVEQRVAFDDDDLTPPTWRGVPVNEPAWKRNVRNVLQQMKGAGELVNAQRNAWRAPTPDPARVINEAGAWASVRKAAEHACEQGTEFQSTQHAHGYRVSGLSEDSITVQRLDAPAPTTISRIEVERAVRYVNAAGGRVGRRAVHHTVAKEVAIVFLHPQLHWSADYEWIEAVAAAGPCTPERMRYADFGQAPDDDPAMLQEFARRVRAGQSKFRNNLLVLYGGRCAISGWGPAAVLQAAHVVLHAQSGLNHTDNGILLRSDLHTLFDAGLLRIVPNTCVVVLDPSLRRTEYWKLQNQALRPRIDGSQPNVEYLRTRWEQQDRRRTHSA